MDLTEKKAVVDTINLYFAVTCDALEQGDETYDLKTINLLTHLKKGLLTAIETMPSAQPERTCVNCGRTVNNGGWYADGRTRCLIEEHYALPKDGYCHLWEKRNVTDDDYPERREE